MHHIPIEIYFVENYSLCLICEIEDVAENCLEPQYYN